MPVRVKQRVLNDEDRRIREKELLALGRNVVGLLLSWDDPVALTMRDAGSPHKLHIRTPQHLVRRPGASLENSPFSKSFDLALIRSIIRQGLNVDPSDLDRWVKTSARSPFSTIRAVISLQAAPSKHMQFISLGVRHLDPETKGNILYDEVNKIFGMSSFGTLEAQPKNGSGGNSTSLKDKPFQHNGFTKKQLKGGGKCVDRWPMFYIRIDMQDTDHSGIQLDSNVPENDMRLSSIVNVLGAMVTEFLTEHHYQPRKHRSRKHDGRLGGHIAPRTPLRSTLSSSAIDSMRLKGNFPPSSSRPIEALNSTESGINHKCTAAAVSRLVGGGVKLPSFARGENSQLRNTYDGWSRIKSGRGNDFLTDVSFAKSLVDAWGSSSRCIVGNEPLDLRFASEKVAGDKNNSIPEASRQDNGSGKVSICLVTADESSHGAATACSKPVEEAQVAEQNTLQESDADIEAARDKTIAWTNPVSGAKFLVNARTGLLIKKPLKRPYTSSGCPESHTPPSGGSSHGSLGRIRLTRSASDSLATQLVGTWAYKLLKDWQNPVYRNNEEGITQISLPGPRGEDDNVSHGRNHRSSTHDIQRAFKEMSSPCSKRMSKEGLNDATVIAQVDRKFILIIMNTEVFYPTKTRSCDSRLFVLIDQHAADERIRVEALLAELCKSPSIETCKIRSNLGHMSAIETTELVNPISFQVQVLELDLFKQHAAHFANWGILFDVNTPHLGPSLSEPRACCRIVVKTLPASIAERCRVDSKHLIELIRGEIWKREELETGRHGNIGLRQDSTSGLDATNGAVPASLTSHSWLQRIHDCPHGILEMLNSRSCRSAIMFNDTLELEECRTLVGRLAGCSFPFQCAHGRPSMIPLVDLGPVEGCENSGGLSLGIERHHAVQQQDGFANAWRRWRTNGREGKIDG